MREKKRSAKKTIIAVVVLLLFGLFYVNIAQFDTTITITNIAEKRIRISRRSRQNVTVVDTQDSGEFIVDSSMFLFGYDWGDAQNVKRRIKSGKTYEVKYYGFHFPFFYMRRNIIEVIKEHAGVAKIEVLEKNPLDW